MTARTLLVLGGVRAGKSAFAVARARGVGDRVVFVATAQALDDEMAARIARHRRERPATWRTVEEPFDLFETVASVISEADVVLVDCLNLWVANLLQRDADLDDARLLARMTVLEAVATRPRGHLILVSNEVGWGVHPGTAIGRRFRDALGMLNQAVARVADEVVLMVAGCPVTVKGPGAGGLAPR